jgi:hypothetical protein
MKRGAPPPGAPGAAGGELERYLLLAYEQTSERNEGR